jgi:hypothetical protein
MTVKESHIAVSRMNLSEEEATAFFAKFYRGEHHFPSTLKQFGKGWAISHFGQLATFDGDELTRLVLLAHERCIRVAVDRAAPIACESQ